MADRMIHIRMGEDLYMALVERQRKASAKAGADVPLAAILRRILQDALGVKVEVRK